MGEEFPTSDGFGYAGALALRRASRAEIPALRFGRMDSWTMRDSTEPGASPRSTTPQSRFSFGLIAI